MQDIDFLSAFEDCTLPKELFNHRGHLRIAWLYLRQYHLNEAIQKTSEGILRYATSLGVAHIYDEALTREWVCTIQKNMSEKDTTFDQFIERNQHLFKKK